MDVATKKWYEERIVWLALGLRPRAFSPSRLAISGRPALIAAPSGAGKTTFVVQNPAARVIDGDLIIGTAFGWPRTPNWSADPEYHEMHCKVLSTYSRITGLIVIFNGDVQFWPPETVAAVVIPPFSKVRADTRLLSRGPTAYGTTRQQWDENVSALSATALTRHWPVFPDFQAAVVAVRSEARLS